MKPDEIYSILEREYFGENSHENQEIITLRALLKDVKVFIDVGASLGQYTYHANKIIQNGLIYAIEADPIRYLRLLELSKGWQSESNNIIKVINAAVGDKVGEVNFFISNSNISGGLFTHKIDNNPNVQWEKITVHGNTPHFLDRLLS